MRAIVQSAYGGHEVLKLEELNKPIYREDEVLVKVVASAINDFDWSAMRGKPLIYRLMFGISKPKNPVLGMELSGIIEASGSKVSKFKPGDEVYGDISEVGFGCFAEYICIKPEGLVKKPRFITHEEAAGLSHASMLAYQGLVEKGKISEGQKVLINGAGGGVGTLALQIAKTFNCHVTGVDAGHKSEKLKALGFDEVIDYQKVDFTRTGKTYDLVLDAKSNRWPLAYSRALAKHGKYVSIGGSLNKLIVLALSKGIIKLFTNKHLSVLALKSNKNLENIHEMYEKGKLKLLIDGPHPLESVSRLIQYFGEGKHTGKIVIKNQT